MINFKTIITVKPEHTEGGILKHDTLITFLQIARVNMLKKHGMSEANIAPGIGFVIGSLNIRYLDGAKENESLEIRITSGQASNKSCSLQYEVSANRRAVAQAETVIVFVNTLTLKPSPVPERFLEMVKPKPEEENLFSFLKSRL